MDGNSAAFPATARYILLPLAHVITGYTVKAMQRKIERGDWQEGKVWRRAPDGRILIDVMGYQRWVESGFRRPPGPLASRGGAEFPERTV